MNLIYGLALRELSVAKWIERQPSVWKVIGLNPVGNSHVFFFFFFLCPTLVNSDHFIFTFVLPSLKFTIFRSFTNQTVAQPTYGGAGARTTGPPLFPQSEHKNVCFPKMNSIYRKRDILIF